MSSRKRKLDDEKLQKAAKKIRVAQGSTAEIDPKSKIGYAIFGIALFILSNKFHL